jgi:hypothetical protein
MPGAAPGLQALAARLPDHVAARSLNRTGRLGRRPVTVAPRTSAGGAASRRPPCAKPTYPRPRRARALSLPSHASGRHWPPGTPLPRQRPGPTGPGRPADCGVRGTYCVPRRLAEGRRSGAADHRGVRDPAGPRLPLRRTGRGSAARSRTTGLADCRPVQEADGAPRNRRTMPAQTGMPHLPSRRGNPASGPGHPGHAIGVRSARTASSRPGQPLDSQRGRSANAAWPLTQQDVGAR